MKTQVIDPADKMRGHPRIPGDKSISHRALLFGALCKGATQITGLLDSEDVQSTARCLSQLGVSIQKKALDETWVYGLGGFHFQAPQKELDCGNSGTTIRLMMGLLANQGFTSLLTGDSSLKKRPMRRIADPLRLMGAQVSLTQDNFAPVRLMGGLLKPIDFELSVASAQMKTALLLAGLGVQGRTRLSGKIHSRDHSERLLKYLGADIGQDSKSIWIEGKNQLQARPICVPSDPSTASFWMAASSLVPHSRIEMENISLNPTRTGFLTVLKRMGALIESEMTGEEPEPVGRIVASYGLLKGVSVLPAEIPGLIDEIPLLAVLATQAEGTTQVTGAEELRVKESDRIEAIAQNLRAMGAEIVVFPDGFRIEGPQKLKGCLIHSFDDHRIAMAFSIAGLIAEGATQIQNPECVKISYPNFFETLKDLTS